MSAGVFPEKAKMEALELRSIYDRYKSEDCCNNDGVESTKDLKIITANQASLCTRSRRRDKLITYPSLTDDQLMIDATTLQFLA